MTATENTKPMIFEVLKSALGEAGVSRLGRLTLPKRKPIETPNFFANTSRGAVPHLTPDNIAKHTSIGGAYLALEDFLERPEPPLFNTPAAQQSPLHAFTTFPRTGATVLAPRRCVPVPPPVGNRADYLHIFTSYGFSNLKIADYTSAVKRLRPDIAIAPANITARAVKPSKRAVHAVERTEQWVKDFIGDVGAAESEGEPPIPVFLPVLALPYSHQWFYFNDIQDYLDGTFSGLAIYDVDILPELLQWPYFASMPRLSLDPPASPHQVLRQVSLGADVCLLPFIDAASDAGVAMTFEFPPPASPPQGLLPLGVDVWTVEPASLSPLEEGCECYTCKNHHRAYLHHLLHAKEMLGWTLLQIHNYHVMDELFSGVRRVLGAEPGRFDEHCRQFAAAYEPELPEGTGERPRARGYHFKSEANATKINDPAWGALGSGEAGAADAPVGAKEAYQDPPGQAHALALDAMDIQKE